MHVNISQFAKRSRELTPSDVPLILERIRSHLVMPRMTPEEFRAVVTQLGFSSTRGFAERIGLPHRTVESWDKFGMSRDAAQLLLALLAYKDRVEGAIRDIDSYTNIGLADFFENYDIP
ncbi:hypothetical protein GCM10007036_16910 [Alsobacter metallidurans]|uniref:Uncharacterized protein n=1 Tax=Alsobacter metallidurans TaxID=340221 RepID=A0A917I6X7_9HYPH|nr:hypothetical protein [Alsobacter metallidurans]GGH16306.1 hypothetical protein GCM10007036_16910 [Alsobacter metallidurans]